MAESSLRMPRGEIGVTGLEEWGGSIEEEFLQALRGEDGIRVFKEMRDNDPVVGGIIFAIDNLIRKVTWRIEPGDGARGEEAAEFIEECMDDMSLTWDDFLSEIIWGMIPFGWSYHEIVYKRREGYKRPGSRTATSKYDDGMIGWRKFGVRAHETLYEWEFDERGGLKGFVQLAQPDYHPKLIPIERSLLFRTNTHKNNPQGRSALRNAYRPWYFKKRIEEIEGIGLERDLAGFPMMYVDPKITKVDASAEDKALYTELKSLVRDVRRDKQEGLVLPNVRDMNGERIYEFDLLSAPGSRQFDTSKIIQRWDERIAMSVLADFILIGHSDVGSFALSSDKTNLFSTALNSWLTNIGETINKYAIARLLLLNGFEADDFPRIEYGDVERLPLSEIAQYLTAMAGAGARMFPDDDLENHLRNEIGWPELPEDLPDMGLPTAGADKPGISESGELQRPDDPKADEFMAAMAATQPQNGQNGQGDSVEKSDPTLPLTGITKHNRGKHDQKTHGRRSGSGSGPATDPQASVLTEMGSAEFTMDTEQLRAMGQSITASQMARRERARAGSTTVRDSLMSAAERTTTLIGRTPKSGQELSRADAELRAGIDRSMAHQRAREKSPLIDATGRGAQSRTTEAIRSIYEMDRIDRSDRSAVWSAFDREYSGATVTLPDSDPYDLATHSAAGLVDMARLYPGVARDVRSIDFTGAPNDMVAGTRTWGDGTGTEIFINVPKMTSSDWVTGRGDFDGLGPARAYGTATHEFGHAVVNTGLANQYRSLTQRGLPKGRNSFRTSWQTGAIFQQLNPRGSRWSLPSPVSEYAKLSPAERLAEGFAKIHSSGPTFNLTGGRSGGRQYGYHTHNASSPEWGGANFMDWIDTWVGTTVTKSSDLGELAPIHSDSEYLYAEQALMTGQLTEEDYDAAWRAVWNTAELNKHQQGKHDQKSHGRGRGGGRAKEDRGEGLVDTWVDSDGKRHTTSLAPFGIKANGKQLDAEFDTIEDAVAYSREQGLTGDITINSFAVIEKRTAVSQMRDRIERDGGFTYSPVSADFPTTGKMVAVPGHELRVSKDQFTKSQLKDFVRTAVKNNLMVGGWAEGNDYVLDVSERFDSMADAGQAMMQRGEMALFDLDDMREVWNPDRVSEASGTVEWVFDPISGEAAPYG